MMTSPTRFTLVLGTAFLLAPSTAAAVQQTGAPPAPQSYEVGRALPPAVPGSTVIELTLEEAVDRALENNLGLQSARLNPEIQDLGLEQAQAAFLPTFSSSLGYNNAAAQSTSQLDGGARITTERNTFNFGLGQTLPWTGGRVTASFNNARTSTDNIFATRNPNFNSSLSLNYTQSLLSGRRIDQQRAALGTQLIQRRIVDIQLRGEAEDVANQVRAAYWNLRSQIEQIEIQRRSLAQAEQLLENNRVRVRAGTMVEMDLAQAEVQVANAEQALLNAELQWRAQELAFKRLLISGTNDPLWQQTVNPVDLPIFEERTVDIAGAVVEALERRPDVQQQREQRQVALMNLDVTREGTLPDLNLSAGYSLQGVGGDLFTRSGLGGEPELLERGGYRDGLQSIANFDTPSLNIALNFSYPVGMRAGRANLERARLQLRQTDLSLRNQELGIETEVTNVGLSVNNAYLQLQAATRSRQAAERSLEAELTRFDVGASTNFQVVTAQDALTAARLAELRAVIGYVNALAEFDRVRGATLPY
ncbi:MAG: TolC family protein [Gemmatimonadales bacterium]|nr:MAG: TolC family protein [Gemmatimonadales bacterium]